ncbi:MAG: hypothetical protein GY749_36470 [Desulfobacteraceae bacterium]|nr:hypothetical protein [Desulfobacteraceae bacterium]
MKKVASLHYGVIFKKAFCVPEIFKAFVKDLLDIDMNIDYVETEKSFQPTVGKIDTKFDLFAEDRENRVVVDIQHMRLPDHYHRFLYYHCIALIEMVTSSKDYTPGLSVYTIVVLTSGDRHKKDVGITDFDPKDTEGRPFNEIPHKIIYLCPKYVNDKTPGPYREWMLAINDSLDEEVDESKYKHPDIRKLFELIEKDMITPKEYAAMKNEYGLELYLEEKARKFQLKNSK